jgi:hypothetical protein
MENTEVIHDTNSIDINNNKEVSIEQVSNEAVESSNKSTSLDTNVANETVNLNQQTLPIEANRSQVRSKQNVENTSSEESTIQSERENELIQNDPTIEPIKIAVINVVLDCERATTNADKYNETMSIVKPVNLELKILAAADNCENIMKAEKKLPDKPNQRHLSFLAKRLGPNYKDDTLFIFKNTIPLV